MAIRDQTALAERLADELNGLEDFDLDGLDLLDALAGVGLRLVPDQEGISARAYGGEIADVAEQQKAEVVFLSNDALRDLSIGVAIVVIMEPDTMTGQVVKTTTRDDCVQAMMRNGAVWDLLAAREGGASVFLDRRRADRRRES